MTRRISRAFSTLLFGALSCSTLQGAPPCADWRTVETAHFRVHYEVSSEEWALPTVSRLESIWSQVTEEVDYLPAAKVDVLVSDPFAVSNGMAIPLLRSPRMILWTNPPGPDSAIGNYSSWPELLTLHESVHLVHMLRPSRNPLLQRIGKVVPVGPISMDAPRWLIEGYATYLEGTLTGSGRPNGDLRAVALRSRALAGTLPSYRGLSSDESTWMGGSMAYLAGSAFLEWLVEREGDDSLPDLWQRMTARRRRPFGESFAGVFGDTPEKLYGIFTAELTWRAAEAERAIGSAERAGELWQDLQWTTGYPAISPDGGSLAVVMRERDRPSRLVILSTGPDDDAAEKRREEIEKLLEEDPDDVPAVLRRPLPREPRHTLPTGAGKEPHTPRWMPDGEAILFVRFESDSRGFRHPDLFVWEFESGKVDRVTHLADLRHPDPAPDGMWAVAVRNRNGSSALVRVDLESGEVEPLVGPDVGRIYASPRIDPGGERLLYLRHDEGAWRLVVRDLEGGGEMVIPTAPHGSVALPAWGADGREVYASVGSGGFIDIHAFATDGSGAGRRVTRAVVAALAPEHSRGDGSLFYLVMDEEGFDIHRMGNPEEDAPPLDDDRRFDLAPAVRPEPVPEPDPFRIDEVGPGRPYRFGRQEFQPLAGFDFSPSSGQFLFGARGGDVLGRTDYLAMVSAGRKGGPSGLAVAGAWRGWPLEVGAHLFVSDEKPSTESDAPDDLGDSYDGDRTGIELSARWSRLFGRTGLTLEGGGMAGRIDPASGDNLSTRSLFGKTTVGRYESLGRWRFNQGVTLRHEGGKTGDDSWNRSRISLEAGVATEDFSAAVIYAGGEASGVENPFDRFMIGGEANTILPLSVEAGRVRVPALPAAFMVGDRFETLRCSFRSDAIGKAITLFHERHRAWYEGGSRGEWLDLAGAEIDLETDPVPILRLPAVRFRVGAARVFDGELEHTTRWWINTVFRP